MEEGASLPSIGSDAKNRRVTYFYSPEIGDYNYGHRHPMKPFRVKITHELVVNYSLDNHMTIVKPYPITKDDFAQYHSDEYVDFLSSVKPEMVGERGIGRRLRYFNLNRGDCPVFEGLFDYCLKSAGGTIGAASKLNGGDADIVINWAGGFHHAKKTRASGFCYVNDIVLGILELLKVHGRVLYVDIDIHHGDGVEEAFYTTDRVMTVSFHKYGKFFPGTGNIEDIGCESGKNYALNVPLNDGLDDESFCSIFQPVIQKVMEVYQPGVVVLQCGADSLSGDRLGCFNLTVHGHADCLRFLRSFNVQLMVLGGGGYTLHNVARCWCYETAVAVGVELDNKLPDSPYNDYFGPDYVLHVEPSNRENKNSKKDLETLRNTLLEKLSKITHAPSVPFHMTPPIKQEPIKEEDEMMDEPRPQLWEFYDYFRKEEVVDRDDDY